MHAVIALGTINVWAMLAQAEPAQPVFEVSSVRLAESVGGYAEVGCAGTRFAVANMPLAAVIQWAYEIGPRSTLLHADFANRGER